MGWSSHKHGAAHCGKHITSPDDLEQALEKQAVCRLSVCFIMAGEAQS